MLVLLFVTKPLWAAEAPVKKASDTAAYLSEVYVAPVAALRTLEMNKESAFGVGADLGFGVNHFVSAHGAIYGYEDNHWRGSAIDEAEGYGRANFIRYRKETFVFYGKGGFGYTFDVSEFFIGVGAGLELRFGDNFSVGGDYTVRAHFDSPFDSLARVMAGFRW